MSQSSGVLIVAGNVDEHGVLTLETFAKTALKRGLVAFKGQRVTVTVQRAKRKRSQDQNAYLHAVPFPILAEFFGLSVEETKRELMGECWGWTVNKFGRHVPVRPHTSDMSVEDCTKFIEWLIPWAMTEWNVWIPLPDEMQGAAASPARALPASA